MKEFLKGYSNYLKMYIEVELIIKILWFLLISLISYFISILNLNFTNNEI
jgi:hypothetical protein